MREESTVNTPPHRSFIKRQLGNARHPLTNHLMPQLLHAGIGTIIPRDEGRDEYRRPWLRKCLRLCPAPEDLKQMSGIVMNRRTIYGRWTLHGPDWKTPVRGGGQTTTCRHRRDVPGSGVNNRTTSPANLVGADVLKPWFAQKERFLISHVLHYESCWHQGLSSQSQTQLCPCSSSTNVY